MDKKPSTLRKSILGADIVEMLGPNNEGYRFNVYSFGERGTHLQPTLIREVVFRLSDSISRNFSSLDYIVAPEPGGHIWGLAVSLFLNVPLVILRNKSLDYPSETIQSVKTAYGEKTFVFYGLKRGDKVVVLDDVVSTGATLRAILSSFSLLGVIVTGVQAIYSKSDIYKTIEEEFAVPIRIIEGDIND